MAYTTVELVRDVLKGADYEEGGTAAELSNDQILYEINAVHSNIDAALHRVYQVPFDKDGDKNVPAIIVQIATDIAAYASDLNYRKGREYDNQNMPVPLRYQRANTLLENLRTGTISIDWPHAKIRRGGAGVFHMYSPALMHPDDIFRTERTW